MRNGDGPSRCVGAILALVSLSGLGLGWPEAVRAQARTTTTTTTSTTSSTSASSTSTSSSTTSSTLPCGLACDDGIATAFEKLLRTVIGCHDSLAEYTYVSSRHMRRCERKRPGPAQDRCLQKVTARHANDLECEHECESLAA